MAGRRRSEEQVAAVKDARYASGRPVAGSSGSQMEVRSPWTRHVSGVGARGSGPFTFG